MTFALGRIGGWFSFGAPYGFIRIGVLGDGLLIGLLEAFGKIGRGREGSGDRVRRLDFFLLLTSPMNEIFESFDILLKLTKKMFNGIPNGKTKGVHRWFYIYIFCISFMT